MLLSFYRNTNVQSKCSLAVAAFVCDADSRADVCINYMSVITPVYMQPPLARDHSVQDLIVLTRYYFQVINHSMEILTIIFC